MGGYEGCEVIGGAAVGERAAGVHVGHEHLLAGAEHLYGLGHEIDAAHHHDVGLGSRRGSFLGESERVAHMVGYILNRSVNIVMGQNHGVLVVLEPYNFIDQLAASRG